MFRRMTRRILRRFGFVPLDEIEDCISELDDLSRYAHRSGHLSNGFKAGKRIKRTVDSVRADLRNVAGFLEAAS